MDLPNNLRYIDDFSDGYFRKKSGRGFRFVTIDGQPLKDEKVLSRIQSLVIPPMWNEVWICKMVNGHLQCTGTDAKGRKQYLYHPAYSSFRQEQKFQKLIDFGSTLPLIRRKVNAFLHEPEFSYKKTLALAVKLLDCHLMRIGNDIYVNENETYGLTTIRKKHLRFFDDRLQLKYKAKSGKIRNMSVMNPKLVKHLKSLSELPGHELFQYWEGDKKYRISSEDVNTFLRELTGADYTAKDFRTWGGTVGVVNAYGSCLKRIEENPRKKLDVELVREVSQILGNTTATARKYYIHPKVLNFLLEIRNPDDLKKLKTEKFQKQYLRQSEATTLAILEKTLKD